MYLLTRCRVHKRNQCDEYVGGEKDGWYAEQKKKEVGGSQESQLCKHVSVRNIAANPKFGIQKHENKKCN